ncbi:hypothetical protein [Emticicia sp. 17c]|uniref:hypothetical protein n=1 Tax=Emticicia sp. 17c TaxID=3127704 RepID=UPI00301C41F2
MSFRITFLLLSLPWSLFAQKPAGWSKQDWDKAIAQKGAQLILSSNKDLLEPNETCMLSVRVLIPPKDNAEGVPEGMPTDMLLPEGEVNPYKVTNWRVVEGGGNIITESIVANYTAPGQAPAKRIMVVSVDCEPLSPNLPKVQLLKTLYFVENETAIVLNMPSMGIINAKFTNKNNGGFQMPAVPANVKLPPDVQAKMQEAQKQLAQAQKSSGYNLSAISSNAMAIYDPKQNLTATRFSELALQAMDGSLQIVPSIAILGFAYKGKDMGTFSLVGKDIGLGFAIPSSQQAFGCGKDIKDPQDNELPCTGIVTITKDDGKTMEGHFSTKIYTAVGKEIVVGSIYGKFTVMKAN